MTDGPEADAPPPERLPVAFISHHSSQVETARRLKTQLESHGVRGWLAPDDIAAGDAFDQAIVEQVSQSDAILLLFCANSDQSRHVKRELILGEESRKPIIPVRLENVEAKGLAYWLKDYQWIDWFDRRDATVASLAAQIRRQAAGGAAARGQASYAAAGTARRGPSWVWVALAAIVVAGLIAAGGMLRGGGDEEPESAATSGDFVLRPGLWTGREEVIEIVQPADLTPEARQQIVEMFEADPTPQECLPEGVARAPDVRLFDLAGEGNCTLIDFQIGDGRMGGRLQCQPGFAPGLTQTTNFQGSYTAVSREISADTTIVGNGTLIRYRSRYTDQWLAEECGED